MRESLRPGYGQVLARARIAKQMSPADVAAKLKLTVRQVEAMESEDLEHLPADVFLRGFVRNYARLVELDPAELIIPMDAQAAMAETITAHSEGVAMNSGGLKRWLLWPLLILGVFVLCVAMLYQWLRQGEDALVPQATGGPAPAAVSQPLPAPTAKEAAMPSAAVLEPLAKALYPTDGAVQPVRSAAKPEARVPEDVQAKPKAGEAEPARPKEAASAGNVHVLRFQPSQDAWIQVVDGEGKRFSKLIRAGDADSISGVAPFKLVVGEAAQVRLTYDGHPIDLTPFIGQKVARLTLE
jgi:cytoskeleton protein RodZ